MKRYKYKYFYFIFCFFILSCASGGKVMTQDNFSQVTVGMTKSELTKIAGEPVLVRDLKSGAKQYEYIERITDNGRIIEVRKYLFIVKYGKVVSKKMVFEGPPLFEKRDSYELQTSF